MPGLTRCSRTRVRYVRLSRGVSTSNPAPHTHLSETKLLLTTGESDVVSAKANLPVDLHIDETNDVSGGCSLLAAAKSLAAARADGYTQPVVCGHCTSASLLPERDLEEVIVAIREAVSRFDASHWTGVWPRLALCAFHHYASC